MMRDGLPVLNLALLFGRQRDAAYWHEWNLFNLPGGIHLLNVFCDNETEENLRFGLEYSETWPSTPLSKNKPLSALRQRIQGRKTLNETLWAYH